MPPHGRIRVTSGPQDPLLESSTDAFTTRRTAVGKQATGRLSKSQGQLIAYVYWYTKVHRMPPSENEIAEFLGVRGPSAHAMIVRLGTRGILTRRPGEPRAIRGFVPRDEIPDLE